MLKLPTGDGDRFAESRAVRFGSAAEAAHPVKANLPALLLALRNEQSRNLPAALKTYLVLVAEGCLQKIFHRA
jgi:hypothetical protein